MARALGLDPPENDSMAAAFLLRAADALLARLEGDWPEREGAWDSAQALLRARWPWAQPVLERLKKPNKPERWPFSRPPEREGGPPHTPPLTRQTAAASRDGVTGNTEHSDSG